MRTMLLVTALMLTIPAAAAAQGGQAESVDQHNSRVVEEELQLDRAARREIQEGLEAAGFDLGGVDGLFGPRLLLWLVVDVLFVLINTAVGMHLLRGSRMAR